MFSVVLSAVFALLSKFLLSRYLFQLSLKFEGFLGGVEGPPLHVVWGSLVAKF